MELIDVYDEFNNPLGYSVDRKVVHENNMYHRHASGWIMNEKGEILNVINLRGINKNNISF